MSPTFAASTLALYWTGITHAGFGSIENNLFGISSRGKWKYLSLGTNIMIILSIILKELGGIILGTVAEIGCRKIGFDPPLFQANDVGHGAILGIASCNLWLQPPSGTDP